MLWTIIIIILRIKITSKLFKKSKRERERNKKLLWFNYNFSFLIFWRHLTSLWIGNVDPKVTEKRLSDIFNEYDRSSFFLLHLFEFYDFIRIINLFKKHLSLISSFYPFRFGEVTTVRCLPEKYCAFVNFKLKDDANKAMQKLQVCFRFSSF